MLAVLTRARDGLLAEAFELEEAGRVDEAIALWPLIERATIEIDRLRAALVDAPERAA